LWYLINKPYRLRDFVTRQSCSYKVDEIVLCNRRSGTQYDECSDCLDPLIVRGGHYGALQNRCVSQQRVLYLARVHVIPSRYDHVRSSIDEIQVTVSIKAPDVSSSKPSALQKCAGIEVRSVVITCHHKRRSKGDFTLFTLSNIVSGIINQSNLAIYRRS